MRASCETDLARKFPLAMVAKWLGNTQAVAMRHYVDVTDADFERASEWDAEATQNPTQQPAVLDGNESQPLNTKSEKPRILPKNAMVCDPSRIRRVEAAGIEPAS